MNHRDNIYISVIVTTYNNPNILMLILEALDNQSYKHFEVLIADDGSKPNTKHMVDRTRSKLHYKLIHVWQKDKGFRAARIRNKAVINSNGDYFIFLDGDCIPRTDFIQNHVNLSEKGWFVRGNRVMLSKNFTQNLKTNKQPIHYWKIRSWISPRIRKDVKRIIPLIQFINYPCRKIKDKKWYGVKTCNLGLWRNDFNTVDGFDELYKGWGREDSDLAVRLLNMGIKRKEGIFATTVLHCWHKEAGRGKLVQNDKLLQQCIKNNRSFALIGMSRHLAS